MYVFSGTFVIRLLRARCSLPPLFFYCRMVLLFILYYPLNPSLYSLNHTLHPTYLIYSRLNSPSIRPPSSQPENGHTLLPTFILYYPLHQSLYSLIPPYIPAPLYHPLILPQHGHFRHSLRTAITHNANCPVCRVASTKKKSGVLELFLEIASGGSSTQAASSRDALSDWEVHYASV